MLRFDSGGSRRGSRLGVDDYLPIDYLDFSQLRDGRVSEVVWGGSLEVTGPGGKFAQVVKTGGKQEAQEQSRENKFFLFQDQAEGKEDQKEERENQDIERVVIELGIEQVIPE